MERSRGPETARHLPPGYGSRQSNVRPVSESGAREQFRAPFASVTEFEFAWRLPEGPSGHDQPISRVQFGQAVQFAVAVLPQP